jgi:hypothetical protein
MIAATCYGLPVHNSPKPIASAYPKYTIERTRLRGSALRARAEPRGADGVTR